MSNTMARPVLHLPKTDTADEAFQDLRAALEWGAALPLTMEQRSASGPLCSRIVAACHGVSWLQSAGSVRLPSNGLPS